MSNIDPSVNGRFVDFVLSKSGLNCDVSKRLSVLNFANIFFLLLGPTNTPGSM